MYSLFTLPSFWTPWLVRRCKCLIRSATSSVALGTGIRKRGPSSGTTFKRSPDMAQSPNFWDLAGLVDGWLYVEGIDVLIDVFSHYFTKAQHRCAKRRLKMFETRVLLLWHFFHRKVMSSCEAMQPKAMQPKTWNVSHPMSSCHGFSSDSYRKCQAYRVVIYLDFPQFAGVSLLFTTIWRFSLGWSSQGCTFWQRLRRAGSSHLSVPIECTENAPHWHCFWTFPYLKTQLGEDDNHMQSMLVYIMLTIHE